LRIDFKIFAKTGSAIPQINNYNIAPMSIGLPPLSLQQEFAAKIEAIEAMKAKVRQSLKEAETLFNERMDYYFN
jgi:type I restriction enzyme S subunit